RYMRRRHRVPLPTERTASSESPPCVRSSLYTNAGASGLQAARGDVVTDFRRSTRRHVLRMGAAAGAGLLVPYRDALALDTPGKLGTPLGPYGERSPFEK